MISLIIFHINNYNFDIIVIIINFCFTAYVYERNGGKTRDNERLFRAAVRGKCNNVKKH